MAQPTPFDRGFSFTDFSAANPSGQQPGTSLDAEFDAAALTIAAVLVNLVLLQRDDGALHNEIVSIDSLSPEVKALLGIDGGAIPWGFMVGTLSDQVDLQLALDAKSPVGHSHDERYFTEAETTSAISAAIAAAIAALVGSAPGVLDTLGEISAAINNDANLYTTLVALINAKVPLAMGVDTVSTTTYTFASADSYRHKRFTHASGCAATVPKNATDPIPVGTRVRLTAAKAHPAGQVTLVPEDGTVTLNSRGGSLKSYDQFSVFEIEKVGTNEWDVLGDVTS